MRVIAIVAWALVLAAAQPAQEPEAIPDFGGEYAELTPRQKALIDDLFRRFTAVSGVALEPTAEYNRARLSTRTTYEAVTHALGKTTLTDPKGDPLGSPLDLIEYLAAVPGQRAATSVRRQGALPCTTVNP